MNLLIPSNSQRRCPKALLLAEFLSNELIAEVLSWIDVKNLMRFRCVCKSWRSLISDPTFVKLHLHRSSQHADFTFVYQCRFVSFTTIRLFENPPLISTVPNYESIDGNFVGSCNGLLCLANSCYVNESGDTQSWFRFWNPATRTMSQELGYLLNDQHIPVRFTFGFDKSNSTYKVLAFMGKKIRVFSVQDNAWRDIQNPPVARNCSTSAVYLTGSVNWLANHGCLISNQYVIISLDLGTETHTQFPTPPGFDLLPFAIAPNLSVLNDCLCFSHDFKQTHFVIWLMKEFGVEDSWAQFIKISYHNLQIYSPFHESVYSLLPICFSEKNGTLLLANQDTKVAILYNSRDNNRLTYVPWWCTRSNYVESLVSHC